MSKLLQAGVAVPKRIFEGRYTMARREVVVEVQTALLLSVHPSQQIVWVVCDSIVATVHQC